MATLQNPSPKHDRVDPYDRYDYYEGMVKQIPAVKARQQLGSILDEVQFRGTDFVIERDGKPMAVVISPAAYAQFRRAQGEAFTFLRDTAAELGRELSQEELERLVGEAHEEVRAEDRETPGRG